MSQTKTITAAQLPYVIQNARNHPVTKLKYQDLDYWEIYQDLKNRSSSIYEDAPEEWYQEHLKRLATLESNTSGSTITQPDKLTSDFSQKELDKPGYWEMPSWLGKWGDITGYGINNSVTGLGVHIASGQAPFITSDDFKPENLSVFENAMSFGVGMLADFWAFSNPLSLGSNIAVKLAGKEAIEQSAKQLTKYYFGRNLTSRLALEGAQEGFEGISKASIKRAFKKETAEEAKESIVKNSRIKDTTFIDELFEASSKEASERVAASIPSKEWLTDGLVVGGKWMDDGIAAADDVLWGLKAGDKLIDNPTLRQVFHRMGMQGARTLGAYSAVHEAEHQIVNNLKEQYGEIGPNAWDRWKKTGFYDDMLKPLKADKILYHGVHGAVGGYVASGLTGMRFMGSAGAFKGKGYKKNISEKLGEYEKNLYEGKMSSAGWIGAEALGFSGAGLAVDFMAKNLTGVEVPDIPFKQQLLQNLFTIGVLKAGHAGIRRVGQEINKPIGELNSYLNKKAAEYLEKSDRLVDSLDPNNPNERALIETIKKEQAKEKKVNREANIELEEALNVFKKWNKDYDEFLKNATSKDYDEIIKARETIEKWEKRMEKDETVDRQTLQGVKDDLKALKKINWKELEKDLAKNLELQATAKKQDKKKQKKIKKQSEKNVKQADEYIKEVTEAEKDASADKGRKKDTTIDKESSAEKDRKKGFVQRFKQGLNKFKKAKDVLNKDKQSVNTFLKDITRTENRGKGKKLGDNKIQTENQSVAWDVYNILRNEGRMSKDNIIASMNFLKQFARLYYKKTEKSLLDANATEINNLAREIFKNSASSTIAKWNAFAASFGRQSALKDVFNMKRDESLLIMERDRATESSLERQSEKQSERATKKDPEPKSVVIDSQERINKIAESEIKRAEVLEKEGQSVNGVKGDIPVGNPKAGDNKLKTSPSTVRAIHYLLTVMGKRGIDISSKSGSESRRAEAKKKGIPFDEQMPILMGNVKQGKTKNGIKYFEITLVTKGRKKSGVETLVIYDNVKGSGKNQILNKNLNYNPYKEIRNIYEMRRKEGATANDPLLVLYNKFSPEKKVPINVNHLAHISERYLGLSQKHQTRHIWFAMGEKISRALSNLGLTSQAKSIYLDPGEGPNFFINQFIAGHKVGPDSAGSYVKGVHPQTIAFRKQALFDIYNLVLEGNLTKTKYNNIIAKYDKLYKQAIKKEWGLGNNTSLWYNKTEPFRIVRNVSKENYPITAGRTVEGLKQKAGLTEHRVASSKVLTKLAIKIIERNKGLKIKFKDMKDAGEFIDGVIYYSEGKANITTLFHENVHRLKEFVYNTKDKKLIKIWERGMKTTEEWAKKNDPEGWRRFQEDYKNEKGTSPTEEYLTQLSAEWAAKREMSTGLRSRIMNWFKQMYSTIKVKMGFGNPKDVAKMFGKIAEEGFSTEGHTWNMASTMKQKTSKERLIEAEDVTKLNAAIDRLGGDSQKIFLELKTMLGLKSVSKPEHLKPEEYWTMRDVIDEVMIEGGKLKRDKTWKTYVTEAKILNRRFGISPDTERALKGLIRIKKVDGVESFKTATKQQVKRYIQYVHEASSKEYGYRLSPDQIAIKETHGAIIGFSGKGIDKIIGKDATLFFPVDLVLRKLGAGKLADKMLDHFHFEHILKGEADYRISNALNILAKQYNSLPTSNTNRKYFENYMAYLMDPSLLKGAKLDAFGQRFVKRGLEDKSSAEYKAHAEIKKLTDWYYNMHLKIARKNIPNDRYYSEFLKQHNKKYVNNYFTRILTKEAREYLNIDKNKQGHAIKDAEKIVDNQIKNYNKKIDKLSNEYSETRGIGKKKEIEKSIRKLERDRDKLADQASNKDGKLWQEALGTAANRLESLTRGRREALNNPYLLERVSELENYITNEKTGKEIKVWETNFQKTMGRYIEAMSKYMSTSRYFPSFVSQFRHTYAKEAEYNQMILEKVDVFKDGSTAGAYVDKALKKRLGLWNRQVVNQEWQGRLTTIGQTSALMGLSSPFSGLKNLVIGTTNSMGMFGTANFLRSVAMMFTPAGKEARALIKKIGGLQIGSKEIDLRGTPGDWWMRWVSWMKPTEAANRFTSAFAGLYLFENLVERMQGKNFSLIGRHATPEKVRKYMKEMWHLTDDEINFVTLHGLNSRDLMPVHGSRGDRITMRRREIRDKVLQYGHVKTQGATAEPFLPLWMQGEVVKPLTLFYRMAYSGTYNVQKHIVKPLVKDGDIVPLVNYIGAGHVFGGALWALYEAALGATPPKREEKWYNRMGMNLAKAEIGSLMSPVFSPYGWKNGIFDADAIMQIAIIRNLSSVGMGAFELLRNALPFDALEKYETDSYETLIKRFGTDVIPFLNHLEQLTINVSNPYKKQVKRTKTLKTAYLKKRGFWEKERRGDITLNNKGPNSSYYNLIKESFLNNDIERAAKYAYATKLYLMANYESVGADRWKTDAAAERNAINAVNNVVRSINPLHFSKDDESYINKRKEFLEYLSEKERTKALNNEKTYYFRMREFRNRMRAYNKKYSNMWRRGQYIDMLPLPSADKKPRKRQFVSQ